jgi:hypothetical protein
MNLFGEQTAPTRLSENTAAALSVMAAAAVVILPALLHGFPAGHDTGLHATAWFDIAQHWREGVLIPGWGARFAYGLGEPVYGVYPPLSMWLGALLLTLFGPTLAPTSFLLFTNTVGGFGVYKFCRLSLSHRQSIFGGVLYAVAPYLALNGYYRNAFAETLSAAIFPFAAYYFQRVMRCEPGFIGFVASLTLIGISDVPAAVVAGTALCIIALVDSVQQRNARSLGVFCGASLLAAMWAAFYILPAAVSKPLVQIDDAVAYYDAPTALFVLLVRQFHFIRGDFISALQVISLVHIALCVIPLCVIVALLRINRTVPMLPLAITALYASLMMLPISQGIYRHIPLLHLITLSWRYLFVLSFAAAVFMSASLQYRRTRVFAGLGIALLAVAWFILWPPPLYRDPSAIWNASFDQRTAEIGPYYDHMPRTVPTKDFERLATLPAVTILSSSPDPAISVKVVQWQTETRRIRFISPQAVPLLIRLISFPGWQASINDHDAPIEIDPRSGYVRVVVQGSGDLVLRYRWTPVRIAAYIISLLSISVTLGYFHWRKRALSTSAAA